MQPQYHVYIAQSLIVHVDFTTAEVHRSQCCAQLVIVAQDFCGTSRRHRVTVGLYIARELMVATAQHQNTDCKRSDGHNSSSRYNADGRGGHHGLTLNPQCQLCCQILILKKYLESEKVVIPSNSQRHDVILQFVASLATCATCDGQFTERDRVMSLGTKRCVKVSTHVCNPGIQDGQYVEVTVLESFCSRLLSISFVYKTKQKLPT